MTELQAAQHFESKEPNFSGWGSVGMFTMRSLVERIEGQAAQAFPGGVSVTELLSGANPTKAANTTIALLILATQDKIATDFSDPDIIRYVPPEG